MKDLSLSALSRGCGRFVSSNQNAGRQEGRLDVYFTPQDYYIWKSQDTVLQLSSRGHVLPEKESSLPKTYSTRRGPLLLYSQYLISLETSCQSQPILKKKKKVMQPNTQQSRTVRELTSAFSSNRNLQLTSSRLDEHYLLPPSPVPIHSTQEQNSPQFSLHSNSNSQPSGNNTRLLQNQLEDNEENGKMSKRVRVDLFLQIPRTSESPRNECQTRYAAMTPAQEAQIYVDASLQHTEINHRRTFEEPHRPNTVSVDDMVDEDRCNQSSKTANRNNYEQSGTVRSSRGTGFLPPIPTGHTREMTSRCKSEGSSSKEPRLPPIAEERTVPTWNLMQKHSETNTEEPQIQKNLLHPLQLVVNDKGRKGLGRGSCSAFLQHRSDSHGPSETNHTNRGVVRGILPLELRGLQDGRSAGSLILGPDGEIIQLSLFVNSQDQSGSDTHEQALQVLSEEGEKLPWVVVLQSECTETAVARSEVSEEDGVRLTLDEPIRKALEHHKQQKLLDLHKQAAMSSPTSPTSAVLTGGKEFDRETVVKTRKTHMKNTRNSITVGPLREQVEREEPRRGNDGILEEVEEEKEDEELDSHSSESHTPRKTPDFRHSPKEAATEEPVKAKRNKRKDAEEASTTQERKGKKIERRVETDGQKTQVRKKQRSQKDLRGTNQSIMQRSEEKSDCEAAEAAEPPDQSTLPHVKEMTESKEDHVTSEEHKEKAEGRKQKQESAVKTKRRKSKLKHKDLIVGDQIPEKEVGINQIMEVESTLETQTKEDQVEGVLEVEVPFHVKSTECVSQAQGCDNDRDPEREEEHQTPSGASVRSGTAEPLLSRRRRSRSTTSSSEEGLPASSVGLASSHGRLSSCSTVMVMEEQLRLNPAKPESSVPRRNREQEEALLARRAERRRQEVERSRRKREEEERKQLEREQTEERLKNELEGDRRKRAEELRLKRLAEEEENKKHEEEEQERARQVQAQRERERRKQEERKRQLEHLQRMREMEEEKRKAELARVRLEAEKRQEEERKMLQEMDESERMDYLQRKEEEEEQRRNKEEGDSRAEEEAAAQAAEEAKLQAELLARQTVLLQQQLAFRRGLLMEAGGLEKTQGISRPWIYSYFTLLQTMGLNAGNSEAATL